MIEKCRYFNDHQTACAMMIDDLVPVAVSKDGKVGAWNDWGYLKDGENSIFSFLRKNLLERFPHIRGTVFLPLHSHLYLENGPEYKVISGSYDEDYYRFLKSITPWFDFGFHGVRHTWRDPESGQMMFEFENLELTDVASLRKVIQETEDQLGIRFTGGKYPGYRKNKTGEKIIEELGFTWWASSAKMINRKDAGNQHGYLGHQQKVLSLPTNISGSAFTKASAFRTLKNLVKKTLMKGKRWNPQHYLQYLYENRLPITVQEHFQSQRMDGTRQTPNIYDDINSLQILFSMLNTMDIWHTTCSALSKYLESYDHTVLERRSDGTTQITYTGYWEEPFISVSASTARIKNIVTGDHLHGSRKSGHWVYDHVLQGIYEEVSNNLTP